MDIGKRCVTKRLERDLAVKVVLSDSAILHEKSFSNAKNQGA
jgi:hypothetical protein